jgi:hypothetical protein
VISKIEISVLDVVSDQRGDMCRRRHCFTTPLMEWD